MRIVSFVRNGAVEAGVLTEAGVVGLDQAGYSSVIALMGAGEGGRAAVERLLSGDPQAVALDQVKLLAPVPRPPKIVCVGLNYRDHALESKMDIPKVPTIFSKFPTTVLAPGDPIVLPRISVKPDYEAEFAFVVGKGGRHIPAEQWREHVYGYMNLNDVSARDFQMATTQWTMGKTFDTFCPMGPWMVTADEIADPHSLDIQLSIHGEVLQQSNTRELIFDIPYLVAFLSSVFTLETGDIVSTGTPSGVGFARKPPRWLRPGDEVVVSVQGLGELRNPVVAEQES